MSGTDILLWQYGPGKNSSRPGGNMTTVRIQSSFWTNVANIATRSDNSSAPSLYAFDLVGDETSLRSVLDVLVSSSCDVSNLTVVPYDGTNTSQPRPESAVQYFRSSSFALTMNGYNNTASLPSNQPADNSTAPLNIPDTPLPTNHTDMTFLACVNTTIGESLPILDSGAPSRLGRTQLGGFIGLLWILVFFFRSFL